LKLGLVLDRLTTGGTERQMEMLLEQLPEDVDVTVLALRADPEILERYGRLAPVRVLDSSRSGYLSLPGTIRRWAFEERIDLILAAHRFSGLLAKLARIAGMPVPVICSLRGRARYGIKQRFLYDFLDLLLMRWAAAVVINPEAIRDTLPSWPWLRARLHLIPNGLRPLAFEREEMRAKIRKRFGWSVETLVVGSMGRIVDVKRPEVAAACIQELRHAGVDARLHWIGDGPLRSQLLAAFRDDPEALSCTGFVDGPETHLTALDVYLHPSSWESTSNAILEAMRAGLPVVARRLPGNEDLIEHELTGFLFVEETELVAILRRLLDQPALRHSIGEAAREQIVARFSPATMAKLHLELFHTVVRQP